METYSLTGMVICFVWVSLIASCFLQLTAFQILISASCYQILPEILVNIIGLRCRLPALTLRQGFEAAPFKLPSEYVEVLGGIDSELFREFKRLFRHGFEAARKHCDRIISQLTQFIYIADEINFSQPL